MHVVAIVFPVEFPSALERMRRAVEEVRAQYVEIGMRPIPLRRASFESGSIAEDTCDAVVRIERFARFYDIIVVTGFETEEFWRQVSLELACDLSLHANKKMRVVSQAREDAWKALGRPIQIWSPHRLVQHLQLHVRFN
ncbi:hypothetical protein HYS28_00740 [Candidatus Uhrbacteria bacterium]|nr:hypothetical protein [Candidatus Uhrbacteria bacterium]